MKEFLVNVTTYRSDTFDGELSVDSCYEKVIGFDSLDLVSHISIRSRIADVLNIPAANMHDFKINMLSYLGN